MREAQQLYLSTAHFRPLVNGYGFLPAPYFAVARAAADLPSVAALKVLADHGVRTVIVESRMVEDTRWAGLESRLQSWPGVRLIASTPTASAFEVSPASIAASDNARK